MKVPYALFIKQSEIRKNSFDIIIIEECPTKAAMLTGEIEYIAYFNTYKFSYGYNAPFRR